MSDSEVRIAKAIADIEKVIECANEVKRQLVLESPELNAAEIVSRYYSEEASNE